MSQKFIQKKKIISKNENHNLKYDWPKCGWTSAKTGQFINIAYAAYVYDNCGIFSMVSDNMTHILNSISLLLKTQRRPLFKTRTFSIPSLCISLSLFNASRKLGKQK